MLIGIIGDSTHVSFLSGDFLCDSIIRTRMTAVFTEIRARKPPVIHDSVGKFVFAWMHHLFEQERCSISPFER